MLRHHCLDRRPRSPLLLLVRSILQLTEMWSTNRSRGSPPWRDGPALRENSCTVYSLLTSTWWPWASHPYLWSYGQNRHSSVTCRSVTGCTSTLHDRIARVKHCEAVRLHRPRRRERSRGSRANRRPGRLSSNNIRNNGPYRSRGRASRPLSRVGRWAWA